MFSSSNQTGGKSQKILKKHLLLYSFCHVCDHSTIQHLSTRNNFLFTATPFCTGDELVEEKAGKMIENKLFFFLPELERRVDIDAARIPRELHHLLLHLMSRPDLRLPRLHQRRPHSQHCLSPQRWHRCPPSCNRGPPVPAPSRSRHPSLHPPAPPCWSRPGVSWALPPRRWSGRTAPSAQKTQSTRGRWTAALRGSCSHSLNHPVGILAGCPGKQRWREKKEREKEILVTVRDPEPAWHPTLTSTG